MPRAQVQAGSSPGIVTTQVGSAASAAGTPGRSLRTLTQSVGSVGALAGLVGVLCYKKDADESAGKEARKEVPAREVAKQGYLSQERLPSGQGLEGEDGKVNWLEYLDYVNFQTNYGGIPLHNNKYVSVKDASDGEAVKQEDVKVDEAAMRARFQDWMKQYGRSYRTEEEKARRYEIFKETATRADKANASKRRGARLAAPNGLADWTDEECERLDLHRGDFDWETYIDHINNMAAHGWYIGHEEFTVSEAVTQ
ncbi:hypothetical protein BAE44_0011986, partial [Dichanthelium oligosanthes]